MLKRTSIITLIFLLGLFAGYALTLRSLFPTTHSNSIYTMAPDNIPYGNKSPAVAAHLALVNDMNLFREQTWHYKLIIRDAQGDTIKSVLFTSDEVGGIFHLEHNGVIKWDQDALAVTVTIANFNYRCKIFELKA